MAEGAVLGVADTVRAKRITCGACVEGLSLIVATLAGLKADSSTRELVFEIRVADDAAEFVRIEAGRARGVTLDALVAVITVACVAVGACSQALTLSGIRILIEVLEVSEALVGPAARAIVSFALETVLARVGALE